MPSASALPPSRRAPRRTGRASCGWASSEQACSGVAWSSCPLRAWVTAQRCAEPLPVGETGAAKARANPAEGDHPVCTERSAGRSGRRQASPRSGSLACAGAAPRRDLRRIRAAGRRPRGASPVKRSGALRNAAPTGRRGNDARTQRAAPGRAHEADQPTKRETRGVALAARASSQAARRPRSSAAGTRRRAPATPAGARSGAPAGAAFAAGPSAIAGALSLPYARDRDPYGPGRVRPGARSA